MNGDMEQRIDQMLSIDPAVIDVLRDAGEEFARHTEALRNVSRSIVASIKPTWQTDAMDGCGRLAALGWTVPLTATIAFPETVNPLTDTEVEAAMTAYFTDDDEAELKGLLSRLRCRTHLQPWMPLLDECIKAYEQGLYGVTVNVLITIVEGVFMVGLLGPNNSPGVAREAGRMKPTKVAGGAQEVVAYSVSQFLLNVFQDARFTEPRPMLLNRHWKVHGRDSQVGTREEAICLFNALEGITLYLRSI